MEIKFKKFTITRDSRQFILKYHNDKIQQNYYYASFESLIRSLLKKQLLKSDAKSVEEIVKEIRSFKREIKKFLPELKTIFIDFEKESEVHK